MALMGVLLAVSEIRVQKRRHGSFRVLGACPSPTPSRPHSRGPGFPWPPPDNIPTMLLDALQTLPSPCVAPPRHAPRPQEMQDPEMAGLPGVRIQVQNRQQTGRHMDQNPPAVGTSRDLQGAGLGWREQSFPGQGQGQVQGPGGG